MRSIFVFGVLCLLISSSMCVHVKPAKHSFQKDTHMTATKVRADPVPDTTTPTDAAVAESAPADFLFYSTDTKVISISVTEGNTSTWDVIADTGSEGYVKVLQNDHDTAIYSLVNGADTTVWMQKFEEIPEVAPTMLEKTISFLQTLDGHEEKISLPLASADARTKVLGGKTVGITMDRENKTAYLSDKNTGII